MNSLARKTIRFLRCEDGATAVEYAIMLCLILLAMVGTIVLLGEATNGAFEYSRDEMEKVMP